MGKVLRIRKVLEALGHLLAICLGGCELGWGFLVIRASSGLGI